MSSDRGGRCSPPFVDVAIREDERERFTAFVTDVEPRLRRALTRGTATTSVTMVDQAGAPIEGTSFSTESPIDFVRRARDGAPAKQEVLASASFTSREATRRPPSRPCADVGASSAGRDVGAPIWPPKPTSPEGTSAPRRPGGPGMIGG